jgi:hypothetical protein
MKNGELCYTYLLSAEVEVKVTLRLSVSQSVLVSSPIWGSLPDNYYCLTITVLFLWGALSDKSESESYVTTDGQSASLSWYKAPIRGLRPDFFSVRNTEYV